GSFGEVWMVQHRKSRVNYAAKTHKPESEKQFESLKKEVAIMSSLPSHPNVLGLEGWHEENQTLTIYTPCYESLTEIFPKLRTTLIKQHTSKAVAKWSKQILKGLQFLHSQKISHRDLKVQSPNVSISSLRLR